ncbi:hypothetical protein JXA47_12795 [Candidatus Sumerlaeota bacterium]|nr:hypothetical protein [Candidatus Sumerlaeota bacterium]
MDHILQESQAWLEQFQASKRAELLRLRSELSALESRRSDLTERVSADNTDRGSQAELNRTDSEIEVIKELIAQVRHEVRDTIIAKRQEMADLLNTHIEGLKESVAKMRAEKERIRTEEMPSLERRREELHERLKALDAEILQHSGEINELNRITIESEDLEFE